MTMIEHIARAIAWLILAITVAFLMAPLVVVIGASLADSSVFDFPPRALSWRWYQAIPRLSGFWQSIALSLQIAAVSTAAALALGTLAAIAVVQGRFPGRDALATFLVSPLMLPGLVIGVAILQAFRAVGLRDAYASLMIAHVVVTLPYVVRTVLASLNLFDFTLIDAARTLGCSYPRALAKVMVPALAPAFLTGGLFAFLASIDNYPISIFLTDVRNKTLPIQMLQYIEESPDPTIAAVSAMIIGFTILVLLLGDRMVGLRRAVAL
jgi:putative spermidine/putrescine transport system permease protein